MSLENTLASVLLLLVITPPLAPVQPPPLLPLPPTGRDEGGRHLRRGIGTCEETQVWRRGQEGREGEVNRMLLLFSITSIYLSYFFSPLPFVPQIRGHIAGTPLPAPLRRLPSSLSGKSSVFSSLIDSNCATRVRRVTETEQGRRKTCI